MTFQDNDPNTLGNQGRWKVFKYLVLIGSYWEAIGVLLFWDKPRIK